MPVLQPAGLFFDFRCRFRRELTFPFFRVGLACGCETARGGLWVFAGINLSPLVNQAWTTKKGATNPYFMTDPWHPFGKLAAS